MHISSALAVAAAVAPIAIAHEGPSMPHIAGLNIRDLKARDLLSNLNARAAHPEPENQHGSGLKARQVGGTDGQCGQGIGTCSAGVCCSSGGWCGTGPDYCYSPGCNYAYGPGCPENATPAGADTSTVARPKNGNVEYGGNGIYSCVEEGMVAITYDDGPLQNYTAHVLDIFKSYNAKATFFMTGNNINKGQIDITPELSDVIKRAYAEGHQIASHTWTHLDLSAISKADRKNQMVKNEMALRNILGFFPAYMRPPYSSCTAESGCEGDLSDLGYHITYFDVDTDDYDQDDPNKIQNSKNWFQGNITAGGASPATSDFLSISHDIHLQTAYNLTDFMLSTITKLGYKPVTVGECFGDPEANWYRGATGTGGSTTTTAPSSPSSTAKVSTDGTCGGTNKFTCSGSTFGNCCSASGWCGSTDAYCGTGCNSAFGTCPGASSVKPASTAVPTTSSAAPPASTGKVSTDGTCGGTLGFTCQGSTFGNCCSAAGWCGSTTAYCDAGCQSKFGTCTTSNPVSSAAPSSVKPASTSAAPPASTAKVSTDGTCGGTKKQTCKGSTFGNCCSSAGWCGSTTAYCGTGCQTGFGTCK